MANSAQARKRARQAVKQTQHNASLRSELRTAIKKVAKAVEAGDKAAAQAVYQASTSVVDSIADKKLFTRTKPRAIRAACQPPLKQWPKVIAGTLRLRIKADNAVGLFLFYVA